MNSRLLAVLPLILGAFVHSAPLVAAEVLTGSLAAFTFTHEAANTDMTDTPVSTTSNKRDYTFLSVGVCYSISGICLGGKMNLSAEFKNTIKATSDGQTTKVTGTDKYSGFGLTAGYSANAFVATYTHFLADVKKTRKLALSGDSGSLTETEEYKVSSAYLIDLGYGFKLAGFRIGPMISIYHFEYDEMVDTDGLTVKLSPKEKDDFIMPHFALWFDF